MTGLDKCLPTAGRSFAETMASYFNARYAFMEKLYDAGFAEYHDIGGDDYDNSVEFSCVGNHVRLSEAVQHIIYDAGFAKAYVNHTDDWETHYNWDLSKPFVPYRGWRRKSTDDGYLINYLPESWGDRGAAWVASGYMTIVSDQN